MTAADTAQAKGTVLVVDDDVNTREALQMALEIHGFSVVAAADGVQALAAVRAAPPDLVLLDLMMPVMSGAEFIEQLRKDERFRDLPVVILSAWPQSAQDVAGVQGFLRKPATVGSVLDAVNHYT